MYTLKNISDKFQAFATAHPNLKGNYFFGIGGEHEDVSTIKKGPPLMIAELTSSTIQVKMENYKFKMWFMCQHQLYENKNLEMLSDLKKIATDFCVHFRQTKQSDNPTFSIDETILMQDFNHSFNNDWCGWYFDINVKQFLDWDKCGIPT